MKQFIRLSILPSLLLSTHVYAVFNPVDGFYGGLIAEISHGTGNEQLQFTEDNLLFNSTVSYSPVSGGGGGILGYKYKHVRIEGEILYNRISKGPLVVGTCTLQSPNVLTPTGLCPQTQYDHFKEKALGYSGSSAALYGLVNGFWDFFSYDSKTNVVPYLGLGVGRVQIKNNNNLVSTLTLNSIGATTTITGSAYQGILGLSYYMDDFTWATMDYRYLSTQSTANKTLPTLGNAKYTLNTLNFTVNFAFDKGAINS